MFIDIIAFNNIYFYLSLLIVFAYLFFVAHQYHKADAIYLKFN
ncbi:MAG: hypothetical protein PHY32_00590 [Candidatus Pacebacteria bacterium]|nr:hypothetical protein [Candidatus Paceibacterota bacterium]